RPQRHRRGCAAGQGRAVAPMVMSHMAVLVDLKCYVAQLGAVVAAFLVAAVDAIHLRVVLPDETCRGGHVVLGRINAVVPEIVNVRGKDRLGLMLSDQTK